MVNPPLSLMGDPAVAVPAQSRSAIHQDEMPEMLQPNRRGSAEWLVAACGIWQVGLGVYFMVMRPALLPEDVRYIGLDAVALQTVLPRLAPWLGKVFIVMGGFMAGSGVLCTYLAWQVMPLRLSGTAPTLLLIGVLTIGLMSVVNFMLNSDFRWPLLVPAAAWIAALGLYPDPLGRRPA
jgi:hypothetical protein